MNTRQISDALYDRLSSWAAQCGESVETFTVEVLVARQESFDG